MQNDVHITSMHALNDSDEFGDRAQCSRAVGAGWGTSVRHYSPLTLMLYPVKKWRTKVPQLLLHCSKFQSFIDSADQLIEKGDRWTHRTRKKKVYRRILNVRLKVAPVRCLGKRTNGLTLRFGVISHFATETSWLGRFLLSKIRKTANEVKNNICDRHSCLQSKRSYFSICKLWMHNWSANWKCPQKNRV